MSCVVRDGQFLWTFISRPHRHGLCETGHRAAVSPLCHSGWSAPAFCESNRTPTLRRLAGLGHCRTASRVGHCGVFRNPTATPKTTDRIVRQKRIPVPYTVGRQLLRTDAKSCEFHSKHLLWVSTSRTALVGTAPVLGGQRGALAAVLSFLTSLRETGNLTVPSQKSFWEKAHTVNHQCRAGTALQQVLVPPDLLGFPTSFDSPRDGAWQGKCRPVDLIVTSRSSVGWSRSSSF